GKKNIEFTMVRESQDGCIIMVNTEIKQQTFQITKIYAPPRSEDRVRFFENWTPPIAEERICIIAVRKALKSLYESPAPQSNADQDHFQFKWIKSEWSLNKKKDIFWRLIHRALPLGYRLLHVDPNSLGDCPNCLKCPISRIIWETAYKALKTTEEDSISRTLDDIFKKHKTAIWVKIKFEINLLHRILGLKAAKSQLKEQLAEYEAKQKTEFQQQEIKELQELIKYMTAKGETECKLDTNTKAPIVLFDKAEK
ncbi:28228_t:CDS:2, partial [Dentiscutata erythropus]